MSELLVKSLPSLPDDCSYGNLTTDGYIEIFHPPDNTVSLVRLKTLLSIDPLLEPLLFLGTILGYVITNESS